MELAYCAALRARTNSGLPLDGISFESNIDSGPGSSVPEPGSILLFGSGVAGVAAFLRRRRDV